MAREKTYNLHGGVPLWATPAGVCDACGRFAFALHQARMPCLSIAASSNGRGVTAAGPIRSVRSAAGRE